MPILTIFVNPWLRVSCGFGRFASLVRFALLGRHSLRRASVSRAIQERLGWRLSYPEPAPADRTTNVWRSALRLPSLLSLPDLFAICKLDKNAPIPAWATTGNFFCVTRTSDELCIVCPQSVVAAGVHCERDWRCLRVQPHPLRKQTPGRGRRPLARRRSFALRWGEPTGATISQGKARGGCPGAPGFSPGAYRNSTETVNTQCKAFWRTKTKTKTAL